MTTSESKPASRQIEVQIMGQSYLLSSPANGEEALLAAVNKVDMAMCRIRDAGKVKARDRIAVLASLNLAYELIQLQQGVSATLSAPAPLTRQADDGDLRTADLIRRLDQALGEDGRLL
jgi:cell division protein ZapA